MPRKNPGIYHRKRIYFQIVDLKLEQNEIRCKNLLLAVSLYSRGVAIGKLGCLYCVPICICSLEVGICEHKHSQE